MKATTNNNQLNKIDIQGFKSVYKSSFELGALNILIGSNGAGKSNFISIFKMMQNIFNKSLQLYVNTQGGPDSILHFGRKKTEKLTIDFQFGHNGYGFILIPTSDNRLIFENEWVYWDQYGKKYLGKGQTETDIDRGTGTRIDKYVRTAILNWRVYHFHDTSDSANVKQSNEINDNIYLRPDARNLAAFLYRLRETRRDFYERIVRTIKMVAPFFNDFILRSSPLNKDRIELEWLGSDSDIPFKAMHFSDGTLRFICLATLLLQPSELQPDTIIIDEPELGLHPYAITVLSSLIKDICRKKQIIISTQSVELLNEFDAEDIIVVDRESNQSTFKRLDNDSLSAWIEDDYSLGDLWKKNILGGRPTR